MINFSPLHNGYTGLLLSIGGYYIYKIDMESKGECTHFNEKKKRKCRMQAYKGTLFCIAHVEDASEMVDCPVDPSHRVLKERVERHLKICNKTKGETRIREQVWFEQGVNKKVKQEEDDKITKRSIMQMQQDKSAFLMALLYKVEQVYSQMKGLLREHYDRSGMDTERLMGIVQVGKVTRRAN